MPGEKKTVEGIQCPSCGDKVWSRHRHDMRYCSCRYCYIDGGRDYLRYGSEGTRPEIVSIEVHPEDREDYKYV